MSAKNKHRGSSPAAKPTINQAPEQASEHIATPPTPPAPASSSLVSALYQTKGRMSDRDEEEIIDLVIASIKNRLIDEQSSRCLDAKLHDYEFNLGGRKYLVRFGANPDKAIYPTAERALRASAFIRGLIDLIESEYNCYVVPSAINAPRAAAVAQRIFGDDPSWKVSYVRESSERGEILTDSERTLELEVVVTVAVGDQYQRMIECVKITTENGKASFDHAPIIRPDQNNIPKINRNAKSDNDFVKGALTLINTDSSKEQILRTLAAAEDSKLHAFLQKLDAEAPAAPIGPDGHPIKALKAIQVNIQPSSLFVCAVPKKTFVYSATNARSGKSYPFNLEWNRYGYQFDESVPLYIKTINGAFEGFTYDASKHYQLFDRETDRLVEASKANKKGCSPDRLTLQLPEGQTSLPHDYKGVSDYAILPSLVEVSEKYQAYHPEAYLVGETRADGGKRHLNADYDVCAYTGQSVWAGALYPSEVTYVNADLKFATGRISQQIVAQGKRSCTFCDTVYYAQEDRDLKYRQKHLLMDDFICCEKCDLDGNSIERGFGSSKEFYTLKNDVYRTDSNTTGRMYVRTASKGGPPLSPQYGGNTFECGHCKRVFFYDQSDPNCNHTCQVCDTRLCHTCATVFDSDRPQLVTGEYLCNACPQPDSGQFIVVGGKEKTVYKAYDKSESKPLLVLDDRNNPEQLFHCAAEGPNGKLIYYQPIKTYNKCECCGRYIGDECFKKLDRNNDAHKKLCHTCQTEINSYSYKKLFKETEPKIKSAEAQARELPTGDAKLKAEWPTRVMRDIKKYLPFLNLRDRKHLKRSVKEANVHNAQGAVTGMIAVLEAVYDNADSYSVSFTIRVGKRTYHFINHNEIITLEGIR